MPFFKCKQCNHIDVSRKFARKAGSRTAPPVCPRCSNDQQNIVAIGDEVSCENCIYHDWGFESCSHPENRSGSDFWSRPQESCYTSRTTSTSENRTYRSLLANDDPAASAPFYQR